MSPDGKGGVPIYEALHSIACPAEVEAGLVLRPAPSLVVAFWLQS